jgi:uncharacterized membrane protein YvbJ
MEKMEFTETAIKLTLGLITTISTIAITYFNLGQTRKLKAELLDKFESAVAKAEKHSVAELFSLIHGLRMNYTDIVELIKHDDCIK